MKKLLLITAAIVASLGIGYAANSLRDVKDHSKCESGSKCGSCNGTGFNGSFNCHLCKGSGRNSSY